ncbi:hypothetical protein SH449x_000469 [Pirellulaceae bacterium SH449]
MPEEPYAPPLTSNYVEPNTESRGRVKRRWVRSFIILNVILIALPIVVTTLVFVRNFFSWRIRSHSENYDPIVYQQTVEVSFDLLGLLAYLVIPNCILVIVWLVRSR